MRGIDSLNSATPIFAPLVTLEELRMRMRENTDLPLPDFTPCIYGESCSFSGTAKSDIIHRFTRRAALEALERDGIRKTIGDDHLTSE